MAKLLLCKRLLGSTLACESIACSKKPSCLEFSELDPEGGGGGGGGGLDFIIDLRDKPRVYVAFHLCACIMGSGKSSRKLPCPHVGVASIIAPPLFENPGSCPALKVDICIYGQ